MLGWALLLVPVGLSGAGVGFVAVVVGVVSGGVVAGGIVVVADC